MIAGVLAVNRGGINAGMLAINTVIPILWHWIVHISCDVLAVDAHQESGLAHTHGWFLYCNKQPSDILRPHGS